MKRFKIFYLLLMVVCIAPAAGVVGYNLHLDPDEIMSRSEFYPFLDGRPHRYKNAGMINSYDMENIVVGGSLIQNLIPSEVEGVMGWSKVYPLTVNGVDIRIIAKTTEYALRKHDIKNVIMSVQVNRLALRPADLPINPNAPPDFERLYDRNPLNDLLIFARLNYHKDNHRQKKKAFKKLSTITFLDLSREEIFRASKDLYQPYMRDDGKFNRPLFISSILKQGKKPTKVSAFHEKNLAENYARHLQPLIERHPDVTFHLVIPPKSYISRQAQRRTLTHVIAYLAPRLAEYPNVKLHSFADNPFNGDLRLFRDSGHTHIEVARYMLQAIKEGWDQVTGETVDAYVRNLDHILETYEVPDIWRTQYHGPGKGNPYPQDGYITYYDAARLVWGKKFSDALYDSIPRSPYLAEESYVKGEIKTSPRLGAPRSELEQGR